MDKAHELLKKYWGYSSFRGPQLEVINTLVQKKDVFVLLPTGAGKSLCYQLPILMTEGICLVISPLIALMEDQVKSLESKGIKALALSSKLNRHETIIAFDNLTHGKFKFLYISPEKLQSEFIQEKISQLNIALIAVDEAHCISEWGHDFRPAYLKIPELNKQHPDIPKIALTATATSIVKKAIIDNLELSNAKIVTGSYFRDNLAVLVQKRENIRLAILEMTQSTHEPIIVYVGTRKHTIEFMQYLNHHGVTSICYHGGLSYDQKSKALEDWKQEKYKVMVATNAFGMGIDKSNVRAIIHTHIPYSIENYIQEIGRAGRDGKYSKAFLVYNDHTIDESQNRLEKSIVGPDYCKMIYGKLNDFYQIAKGTLTEELFNFDLQEFSLIYKLSVTEVYQALVHLHNENIILYDQSPSKNSKIKITDNTSRLFQLQASETNQARVLQILLRTYGGIHDQFVSINELLIARKLGLSKQEVIYALKNLSQDKVISYHQSSKLVKMKFLVPREDDYIFYNIKRNIQNRNKAKKNKAKAVFQFIKNDRICRQIQLLSYFSEQLNEPCGICDVCVKNQDAPKINHEVMAKKILNLFEKSKSLDANEISNSLQLDKKFIIKTLELMLESKSIHLNLQNKFERIL